MKDLLLRIRKSKEAYLWMSLAMFIVSFSTVYPIFFAIDYSLWETNIFTKENFVWLENYITLINNNDFWAALYNSLYFTFVGGAITFVFGLVLALMLRKGSKGNSFYRTVILIPWVTNEIAFSMMWLWILNPQLSPLYYWFDELGIPLTNLLNNPDFALITLTVINGLRAVGFALVMLLAAFSTIPRDIEEAAEVDGCNGMKKIWHIYLPMIRPVIVIVIIVLTISYFNIIGIVLLMTGGGPLKSTELLSVMLYKEGFSYFNIAIASTLTTIILFINLIFAWFYSLSIKSEGMYH